MLTDLDLLWRQGGAIEGFQEKEWYGQIYVLENTTEAPVWLNQSIVWILVSAQVIIFWLHGFEPHMDSALTALRWLEILPLSREII